MEILVAGGTGFVGRALCPVLVDRGHRVTAASRTPDADGLPAAVETVAADVTDPDLESIVDGHDAVVNLVALPSHVQPRGRSHEAVHFDGTRHLVAASERAGVDRFVQLSGLGVESGVETAYFRAKRRAERVVRDADLEWVIYRPSVVFGDGCAFVPFVERTVPPLLTPLPGGGRTRLQPVWVEDLAPMLADGLEDDRHVGNCYEIGGPERLTLAETVTLIRGGGVVVPIPMALAAVLATVIDPLPWIPFGRDQYRVLEVDNTTADNDVTAFGADPESLQTLSTYLATDGD
ncbi:complex I NDUFA9 subunit family protein [Natrinema longum]|uniref:Complex I NDUFA9 subunit family protein n=1 Tax=Natrinema longum TaxID=370324 RepID=A0A8A2UJ30_9EURY|nr:complex I NDUFA9 subunit family protein [Natrinema longum]MBZ6495128.1 complex I NDUFA9 subunit family protein [Natrinema longum]QSW86888.1 complex I NDUFA9 subunit family protein [Natrinema longum]